MGYRVGLPTTSKPCRVCRTIKPLAEFSKNARMSDGLDSRCKVCARSYFKVRGLLCRRHNAVLGLLDEDLLLIIKILGYLNGSD